jgi:hypothetical protein
MKQHFVTFLSPGTFVAEDTTKPISAWDVKLAQRMAKKITERYNATPYGFYFTTRERNAKELDSKETKRSGIYYLPHCRVETLEEIKGRNDPKEAILVSNMECNGWDRMVTTTKGWRWMQPLGKNDVVLTDGK